MAPERTMAQTQTKSKVPARLRPEDIPLCVDLDGTLLEGDTFFEGLVVLTKQRPWLWLLLPFWLLRGRAYLKWQISVRVSLPVTLLPYRQDVLLFLKSARARGQRIYLVTGAAESFAHAVANHLDVFSGVLHSSRDVNNIGAVKADLLCETFGEQQFDYVGDSFADVAVWSRCRKAYMVDPKRLTRVAMRGHSQVEKIFTQDRPSAARILLRACRVHQWLKNTLLFFPMVLAHKYDQWPEVFNVVIAFFAFSLLASAIYLVNDLVDLASDREHPDKKKRPLASGQMSIRRALGFIPVLLFAGFGLAAYVGVKFLLVVLLYAVATNLYTFLLKRMPIADVLTLSTLYSVRLVAGGIANDVLLSPWLIGFSGFFFTSLAMIKRVSELMLMHEHGRTHSSGRDYQTRDLNVLMSLGTASGYGAVVVLALYVNSGMARAQYQHAEFLWAFCPLVVYWLSRMWLITNRGGMHSDPVRFAIEDRASWVVVGLLFGVWLVARGF